MIVEYYNDLAEKKTIILAHIAAKNPAEIELYNDDAIDINGNPTKSGAGRLTFGPTKTDPSAAKYALISALEAKINSGTITQTEVIAYLKARLQ